MALKDKLNSNDPIMKVLTYAGVAALVIFLVMFVNQVLNILKSSSAIAAQESADAYIADQYGIDASRLAICQTVAQTVNKSVHGFLWFGYVDVTAVTTALNTLQSSDEAAYCRDWYFNTFNSSLYGDISPWDQNTNWVDVINAPVLSALKGTISALPTQPQNS